MDTKSDMGRAVIVQGSPEWFAERCGKLTASRFSDLMAVTKSGPSTSRKNLIAAIVCERLTGSPMETYSNAAMERGKELEDEARAAYEARVGDLVGIEGFATHPDYPYVGCSADGICGNDGLVEIKCPAAMGKHLDAILRGDHAVEYRWQLQGQMFVKGRQWNDAVSYDPRWPDHLKLAIVRVHRDEKAIAELEAACIQAESEICGLVEQLRKGMP